MLKGQSNPWAFTLVGDGSGDNDAWENIEFRFGSSITWRAVSRESSSVIASGVVIGSPYSSSSSSKTAWCSSVSSPRGGSARSMAVRRGERVASTPIPLRIELTLRDIFTALAGLWLDRRRASLLGRAAVEVVDVGSNRNDRDDGGPCEPDRGLSPWDCWEIERLCGRRMPGRNDGLRCAEGGPEETSGAWTSTGPGLDSVLDRSSDNARCRSTAVGNGGTRVASPSLKTRPRGRPCIVISEAGTSSESLLRGIGDSLGVFTSERLGVPVAGEPETEAMDGVYELDA